MRDSVSEMNDSAVGRNHSDTDPNDAWSNFNFEIFDFYKSNNSNNYAILSPLWLVTTILSPFLSCILSHKHIANFPPEKTHGSEGVKRETHFYDTRLERKQKEEAAPLKNIPSVLD